MIYYTIKSALSSYIFDKIIISTDDDEIRNFSLSLGVSVIKRPNILAGDMVSATDVCLHVINKLEKENYEFDTITCLQPTSPLRNVEDIINSEKKFVKNKANFLVSVTSIDPHYFHWAVQKKHNNWELYFQNKFLKERQLLPPVYRPNGAIKIAKIKYLKKVNHFFGPKLEAFEMPEERSIHIAYKFDFDLAENLYKKSS